MTVKNTNNIMIWKSCLTPVYVNKYISHDHNTLHKTNGITDETNIVLARITAFKTMILMEISYYIILVCLHVTQQGAKDNVI
jgi:hypothetical protein